MLQLYSKLASYMTEEHKRHQDKSRFKAGSILSKRLGTDEGTRKVTPSSRRQSSYHSSKQLIRQLTRDDNGQHHKITNSIKQLNQEISDRCQELQKKKGLADGDIKEILKQQGLKDEDL